MPTASNSITVTAFSIITAALQEIGALSPGETPSNEDQAWVLQKLQRLIDRYNAREPMIYNVNFTLFTLNPPANPLDPTTIGPGGDFDVNQRPVKIESIGLILDGGTPGVELPLNMRDDAWWANNRIKGLTSTLPTDAYYSPQWPLGQIFFWPVPTASHQVRLETRQVLGEFTAFSGTGGTFSMPPAYWDLIVYELAITCAPSFEREPSQTMLGLWKAANKAVQGNNIQSPRLASDSPTQSNGSGRPDFNFLDGLTR
jgi:hypothetical protein